MNLTVSLFVALISTAVFAVASGAPTGSTPSASTLSPAQITLQHYFALNAEMDELRRFQKAVYDDYKVDRFADPDLYVPLVIADMPNLSGLTQLDRFAMNESDLLQLHRSNLQAFEQFMSFLELDESMSNHPTDFGMRFRTIRSRLARVVANIEAVMSHLDFFQDGLPTPSQVSLDPENSAAIRDLRCLYTLQEMHYYLLVAQYDFTGRFYRRARNASLNE